MFSVGETTSCTWARFLFRRLPFLLGLFKGPGGFGVIERGTVEVAESDSLLKSKEANVNDEGETIGSV